MSKYRISILAAALCLTGMAAYAQSPVDAYQMSTNQLRGTARFVGMGGAFTSLGGDLSSMTQNPAGIGVYRRSEVGLTFDISMRGDRATTPNQVNNNSRTKAYFDNFGYVGAYRLNGALRNFNWGVSYNRLAAVNRRFKGYNMPSEASLSNYIASYTNGVPYQDLDFTKDYNPYLDPNPDGEYQDWLSVLAYTSYMITAGDTDRYTGLRQPGTVGDALYYVEENGYTDSYEIDFAGNVSDVVYWGLGIGIVDMNYTRYVDYSESMENGLIYYRDALVDGNAGFAINNYKNVSGTGANLKFGVIVRPLDFLKIGLAVHTPTWMTLNSCGNAYSNYNYTPNTPAGDDQRPTNSGHQKTENFDYDWHFNSPWRIMLGASTVIGGRAIVSLDYERVAYNNMSMGYKSYDYWGDSYVKDEKGNNNIKDYFKGADIIRAGVEVVANKHISVRAGFSWQGSNVRNAAKNGQLSIATAGTDPSYSFDNDTYNICVGLGYRLGPWYVDATYQHMRQNSVFHAFTPYQGVTDTPSAEVASTQNNILISTGFRF